MMVRISILDLPPTLPQSNGVSKVTTSARGIFGSRPFYAMKRQVHSTSSYLAKEARAYHYIQEARQQKPQLFLNAALAFLERDELNHSVSCLNGAALCFKNSRPPKQIITAKLYERLEAAQLMLLAGKRL